MWFYSLRWRKKEKKIDGIDGLLIGRFIKGVPQRYVYNNWLGRTDKWRASVVDIQGDRSWIYRENIRDVGVQKDYKIILYPINI